jgi:predicted transcriptional regulator
MTRKIAREAIMEVLGAGGMAMFSELEARTGADRQELFAAIRELGDLGCLAWQADLSAAPVLGYDAISVQVRGAEHGRGGIHGGR